jgi:hypothetical protein
MRTANGLPIRARDDLTIFRAPSLDKVQLDGIVVSVSILSGTRFDYVRVGDDRSAMEM